MTGDTRLDFAATAPKTVAWTGAVKTTEGKPLADGAGSVAALLAVPGPMGISFDFAESRVTGGKYGLELLAGEYDLVLSLNDVRPTAGWDQLLGRIVVSGAAARDLAAPKLSAGHALLTGKVVGADGSPVAGATLSFQSTRLTDAPEGLAWHSIETTSAGGAYSASLPPGEYRLMVQPASDIELASPRNP